MNSDCGLFNYNLLTHWSFYLKSKNSNGHFTCRLVSLCARTSSLNRLYSNYYFSERREFCRQALDRNKTYTLRQGKGKGKVHPITGHEVPEGEQMYSSTLPSTSALDRGGMVNATPRPLYPRKRPVTHCIGGWVGPRAGLEGCGKSCPHRDSGRLCHFRCFGDSWTKLRK